MNQEKNIIEDEQGFAFTRENYILLAIGLGIIVLGFILMSGGGVEDPNAFYPNNDPTQTPEIFSFRRITLAPILVLLGFFFEMFAIMATPESKLVKLIFRKK